MFTNLMEVREQTEVWMDDYNNYRPHKSLGNKPPRQYNDIDLLKTLVPRVSNKSTSQNHRHNERNLEKCLP